ncbi:oxidoreductase [Mariannaea sp. PMI_226]|nr:oxidoreductase [Mariannaea sp. PMI_226]
MAPVRILIVGCGIAGPALASFLLLSGIPASQKPHITILERSEEVRAHLRGQNIDIRGAGVTLIRKLGIETLIRSSTTEEEGVQLVDKNNRVWSSNKADKTGKMQTPTSDIEILRGRLAEICWKNSQRISAETEKDGAKGIEYIFGDYLDELVQDGSTVHVHLAKSGQNRTYDLVVGADGLQSQTRKLVWGIANEEESLKRLGMYAGFFSIPCDPSTDDKWRRWFHAPGRRGIMLRPDDQGVRTTIFMYVVNERDPRFVEVAAGGAHAQKALLEEYFQDAGWECSRIIQGMKETDDFYYDMVAQVKMDKWSKGRVVLLGDAGYCASPISGMGTTLALTGAYNLAGALKEFIQGRVMDPSAAFAKYEEKMRPTVEQAQKLAPGQPRLINPETAWGVWMLHAIFSILSWTKILFVVIGILGRFVSIGPTAANHVPIDDYGFKEMPDWKDDVESN